MQHNCHDPSRTIETFESEGDSTHTAIFIYLQTLNSFSQGHVRQDPGVNSKKKPDSDEEEKERRRERRRRRR
jgi:hypothetical protein